ncbi:MAG: serine/threonine protein kinase, partial [Candidatus Obscuribacterales bacterium]|nr:serine/threonine protein kinase [Candidatus Obscuribacterales bacterium]
MGNPNDTPTPILDEKIQPSLQKQDPHVIAGRYTVLEKLGQGGMGRVYRAIDPILDRVVAVKVLISDELDERYIARFQREARAASHLEHSSIVRVIDFGITGENQPYMVLDLVEGEPLDELLQRQSPLSLEEAIEIMSQLCDAMQHAHNKNTIHRDLKPANIMIVWQGEKLRAMILDFGIA